MRPNRSLRDAITIVLLSIGLALCLATGAFGEIEITPPPSVVTNWPVFLKMDGLAADDLPNLSIKVAPQSCFIKLEGRPSGQWIEFEAKENGRHVLSVVIDGKGYHELFAVEVGGDGPGPDPQPNPNPGPDPQPNPMPPPGPRRIVVIIEKEDQTPDQVATIHTLHQWADTTEHEYLLFDPDKKEPDKVTPAKVLAPYLRAIQQRGVKLPVLIIDAAPFGNGGVEDAVDPLSATGAAAIERVEKEAGG